MGPIQSNPVGCWVVLGLSLAACMGDNAAPSGLAPASSSAGPTVVFDLDARPLPEIPFPNDLATRFDFDSPTGRRVNISEIAPTRFESLTRERGNGLDGFGTYAPLSLRFDAPLDLSVFEARHQRNLDTADDAVFVVAVDPQSPDFCQPVTLDLGRGNFPLTLADGDAFIEHDPRGGERNLMFETIDEDTNDNGVLDPLEDTDLDDVLDRPNTNRPDDSPTDDLIVYYERQTNTLILRPLVPLQPATTYAAIITNRVHGLDGQPVRSPFPWINHTRQTAALRPLLDCLPELELSLGEIAFTWSFTTQSVFDDLEAIRAGLYGVGSLSGLGAEFPAEPADVIPLRDAPFDGPPGLLYAEELERPLAVMLNQLAGGGPDGVQPIVDSFQYIDYVVALDIEAPNFLIDRGGSYRVPSPTTATDQPDDDDESFSINPLTGRAVYGTGRMGVICTVPKTRADLEPPFAVTFFIHGAGQGKYLGLGFAGFLAREGVATCSIDATGHGFEPTELGELLESLESLFGNVGATPMVDVLQGFNARDNDNDGLLEPGWDYWTADVFHTRDMIRQTVVNLIQLTRIVRSWDGQRSWSFDPDGDGATGLAGDFDGDGVVDFGGPTAPLTSWGISLGGIVAAVFGGAEPALSAVVPVSGGGGLADVALRSTQAGVPQRIHVPILGPLYLGERDLETNETRIYTVLPQHFWFERAEIARTRAITPGNLIHITNLESGDSDVGRVQADGSFRVQIPADAPTGFDLRRLLDITAANTPVDVDDVSLLGDRLRIDVMTADGFPIDTIDSFRSEVSWLGARYPLGTPLVALHSGLGFRRNTPDIRRLHAVSQTVVESGDPINWVTRLDHRPPELLAYDPDVPVVTNALFVITPGDTDVNIQSGFAMARAAGVLEYDRPDPRYGVSQNDVVIQTWAMEGIGNLTRFPEREDQLADLDDLDEGTDGFYPFTLDPPLRLRVETATGVHGLRIPYINPTGAHIFQDPRPNEAFDIDSYMIHQVTHYLATAGAELIDAVCLEDASCDWLPE